jgi:hypothetical protein
MARNVMHLLQRIKFTRESGYLDFFIIDEGNYTGNACECGIVMTTLKAALSTFALNYCSSTASQEQNRFIKQHLGLPSGQMTTTHLSMMRTLEQ